MAMQTMVLQNVKLNWAKLLGKPVLNYSEDGYEWSVDVVVDKPHIKALKQENVGDYFKEKNGETFFKYRRPSEYANGSAAKPIPIVDKFGKEWDQTVLIGNGTVADIQITFAEMKRGKNKGLFKPTVLKIKINDLVEYNPGSGSDFSFETAEGPSELAEISDEWV